MRSRAQWRWAYLAEQRGELAPGTADRWVAHSRQRYAQLPEYVGSVRAPDKPSSQPRRPRFSAWGAALGLLLGGGLALLASSRR